MQFPNLLKGCLWIHFIDNVGAQHSLVRGSASILSGDLAVGAIWRRIAALDIYPYFDRVASASNPLDGLSRRVFEGPWRAVKWVNLPLHELM